MKKVVYVIPGYGGTCSKNRGYKKLANVFQQYGIEPIGIDINWGKKRKERLSDYTRQFLKIYKKKRGVKTYVLGFSFGATIAFLSAQKSKPDCLILCSLSPYFKEDLQFLKPSWLKWWKDNFEKSDYSVVETARKIKSKTFLVVEGKDNRECLRTARGVKNNLRGSSLFIAKGAGHNIGHENYLKIITKIASKLRN